MLAAVGAVFIFVFPIYTLVLLTKNYQVIKEERQTEIDYTISYRKDKSYYERDNLLPFRKKYGTLYDTNHIKSFKQLWFYVFFMLRRLLLAIVLVQWESTPQFQI